MLNHLHKLGWLALWLLTVNAPAQVSITEFMADNAATLKDADGDHPDWIELYNASADSINLAGWSLTDESTDLKKWRFPGTNFAAKAYLVVFASGKDRRVPGAQLHTNFKLDSEGEYLALVKPDGVTVTSAYASKYPPQIPTVSFGLSMTPSETALIPLGATGRLQVPVDDSLGLGWTEPDFDDGGWKSINAPLGFGSTVSTDVGAAMHNVNASVYVRLPFAVEDAFDGLTLRMKYDDGFIAYLNGVEVASRNMPLEPAWNSVATAARADADAALFEEFDLTARRDLLQVGENVLAIHGLNVSAEDADFLLLPELRASGLTLDTMAPRYFSAPTPGANNGLGNTILGPLILEAKHSPAIPRDNDALLVTARLLNTFEPIGTVTLVYRVMYSNEVSVAMFDDGLHGDGSAGDGLFGGVIPAGASTPGQMVRYFITATDSSGDVSRWPLYQVPNRSPQYRGTVVTDPSVVTALPVFHWFLQSPNAADGVTGAKCSLYFNGEFYDNIRANIHGQSSGGFRKKSYDFDLNPGDHLQWANGQPRVDDFNLLTTYPDKSLMRNLLAYETYRDAGAAYHFVVPVRVQRNGAFFSVAHLVENGDDNYLERLGLDPRGALYKMYNTLDSATGEKKTRKCERNTDLQALISGCRKTGTARTAYVFDNVNIPAVVNFLAAMTITGNVDCCHKNYYVYRDTEGTGEWQMLPWDQDLSFGRVWNGSQTYWDEVLHANTSLYVGSGNTLGDAMFNTASIKAMYHRRLRTLMEELMQAPNTPKEELKYERRVFELTELMSPDAAADLAKWKTFGKGNEVSTCCVQTLEQAVTILTNQYLPARRNYLFVNQSAPRGPISGSQPANAVIAFGRIEFNPESGNQAQEFIELTNANTYAVDLSGWKLAGAVSHLFQPGVVLPARSALFVSPSVVAFRARTNAPRGGQGLFVQGSYRGHLSARGGIVQLLDKQLRLINELSYAGSPTLAQQYLRITEIMFHPAPPAPGSPYSAEDIEYLELKNIGPVTLDLTGVHFSDGIEFSFTGTAVASLGAGQYVVIVANEAAFASRYGAGLNVAGQFTGRLDNAGEKLRLDDAAGETVLDFYYDPQWYVTTDGFGFSLVVMDELAPWTAWSEPTNWRPNGVVTGESFDTWREGYFSSVELADVTLSGEQADPDGDGFTNRQEFTSGTHPRDGKSFLNLESMTVIGETGSNVKIRFHAMPGKTYSVHYRDSLSGGIWMKLANVAAPAEARAVELSDAMPRDTAHRFYRLVTPQQP